MNLNPIAERTSGICIEDLRVMNDAFLWRGHAKRLADRLNTTVLRVRGGFELSRLRLRNGEQVMQSHEGQTIVGHDAPQFLPA